MAKRPRRRFLGESVDFAIDMPTANTTLTVDNTGMVTVQMDDGGLVDDFAARIYAFSAASGTSADPISGPTDFPGHASDCKRILSLSVGTIAPTGSGNNRVVQVEDKGAGRLIGHPFRAVPAGSGSLLKKVQVKFCKPGQLVPVALTLKLDSKVTRGTCARCARLNEPALLLHSDEAKGAGYWYSRPIAFGGKDESSGYWILERSSATAWTLVLKQGDKVLVTFTAKTKPKDCALPIKLQRKGAGSKACKNWPKTVSISPVT